MKPKPFDTHFSDNYDEYVLFDVGHTVTILASTEQVKVFSFAVSKCLGNLTVTNEHHNEKCR